MDTLYKRDKDKKLLYRETWIDEEKQIAIIHSGKVGYKGKKELLALTPERYEIHLQTFRKKAIRAGYQEIPQNKKYTLTLQYTMRSKFGTKRDRWLRNRLLDYLENALQWKGVGHVNLNCNAEETLFHNFQFTIGCTVVDDTIATNVIQTCLKEYYLDYTKPIIQTQKIEEENSLSEALE